MATNVKQKSFIPRKSSMLRTSMPTTMIITISHMGYIKRTPLSQFRAQNRGGVGAKGSNTREEDFIEYIYPASMHNYMLFFTQKGKCYWLKVYEIPEGAKNSKGRAIQELCSI